MSERHQHLASVYGFCTGVTRALDLFYDAIKVHGAPVYVLHELVHNAIVTAEMMKDGAIFVDAIDQVPDGAVLLLGAHGITRQIEHQLKIRSLTVVDATCPLVRHLHESVAAMDSGSDLILFGKSGHPESAGILSQANGNHAYLIEKQEDINKLPGNLNHPVFLSQTTMNYRDCQRLVIVLQEKYPGIAIPANVCRASYERQKAVEQLAEFCDYILVIGSAHSSNANRLVEIARECGVASSLVESADNLPDLSLFRNVGITAGASTPAELVNQVERKLEAAGFLK